MTLASLFGSSNWDLMAESSRKRKATVLDQQGSRSSDGNSQSSRGSHSRENLTGSELEESYKPHKTGSLMGMNEQRNIPKAAIDKNLQFSNWSKNTDPQFSKFKSQKGTVVKVSCAYESMKPPEAHFHEPSLFHKSPVGDILASQHVAHDVACQSEAIKNQLHSVANNKCTEKIGSFPSLNNGIDLGNGDAFNSDSLLRKSHESVPNLEESQPVTIKDTGFHEHENINGGTCILDFCGVGSVIHNKSNENFVNTAEAGDTSVDKTISSSQSTTGTDGTEASASDHHSIAEVRSGTSPAATSHLNAKDDNEKQADSFSSPVTMSTKISEAEKTWVETGKLNNRLLSSEAQEKNADVLDQYNAERSQHSNAESPASKATDSPASKATDNGDDLSNILVKSDRKSRLRSRKVASKIIEKLWEGLLQLNTSITVSAIAYFKSGEKAPEFNWSKHVAVKGKVRLEAFEKYIQELPRSRNRALMVISLCWRVGSSKSGLTGIKEVSKDYKEEKKVGFAQLAPGVDLYVCPRSDTIITILAKYGFFKGMAAVEDDQDSLIGCVVWRRNRLSSKSVSKRSERKTTTSGEPLNSPESSVLRGVETYSPVTAGRDSKANHGNRGFESSAAGPNVFGMKSAAPVSDREMDAESKNSQLVQDSQANHADHDSQCSRSSAMGPAISDIRSIIPESERNIAAESKNILSVKDHLDVDVSKDAIQKSTPLVQGNSSTSISKGQLAARKPHSSSLQDSIQQLMKVENAIMQIMETKKRDAGVKLLEHVQTGPSRILLKAEHRESKPDDDDLPEFDFGTACGNSQLDVHKLISWSVNPHFPDPLLVDKKVLIEGTRNACGPTPSAPSGMRTMSISNKNLFPSLVHGGFVLGTQMRTAVANQCGDPGPQAPFWPASEQKPPQHSNQLARAAAAIKINSAATQGAICHNAQKNLWDDDDDMPEWRPPDLDQAVWPPQGVTSGPSELSSVHNTRAEKVVMETIGPQFPSRYPVFLQPPSRVQDLPHGLQPGLQVQSPVSNMVMPPQTRTNSAPLQSGPRRSPGFSPDPTLTTSSLFEVKLSNTRPAGWRGQQPRQLE